MKGNTEFAEFFNAFLNALHTDKRNNQQRNHGPAKDSQSVSRKGLEETDGIGHEILSAIQTENGIGQCPRYDDEIIHVESQRNERENPGNFTFLAEYFLKSRDRATAHFAGKGNFSPAGRQCNDNSNNCKSEYEGPAAAFCCNVRESPYSSQAKCHTDSR